MSRWRHTLWTVVHINPIWIQYFPVPDRVAADVTPLAHFRGGLSCRFLRTRRDHNRNQGDAIQSGGHVRSQLLTVAAFLNWGEGRDSQSSCTAGGRKPGDLRMWDASVATESASAPRRSIQSLVSFSARATSSLRHTGQEVQKHTRKSSKFSK